MVNSVEVVELAWGCGTAVFTSRFYNARPLGVQLCMLMLVSVSWASFEGMLLCILNLEWCSSVLVVAAFELIMGGNYRNGLFSEVRETGAYKVRPGGFRRSEGRRCSRCVGSPLYAVIPFILAVKCCGNSYATESGSTGRV